MASKILNLLKSPWWIISVFSQAKSFVAHPVLGNTTLNWLGLHVARLVAAHALRRVRLIFISPFVDKQYRQSYWRDGFVVIEDFLPRGEFEKIDREVRQKGAAFEVRECVQGDTLTHRVLLDEDARNDLPGVNALIENKQYKKIMALVGATNKRPLFFIQRIANGFIKGNADPQKNLHSDTFHPTMKAWYFLDDVPLENGPFNYVPGSHRLTLKRLKWEYWRSVNYQRLENVYSQRGSLRVTDDDLEEMGLGPARAVTAAKNTLVVADTHGFHCRGKAQEKASRLELWAYSRTNPFSIYPGIGSALFSRLEYLGANALWKNADRKAAANGNRSSWHIVDSKNMFDDIQDLDP